METMPLNLFPGEWLLWEGRPVRSTILRPNDAKLIPFTVVFACIAAGPVYLAVYAVLHVGLFGFGPFGIVGLFFAAATVYMLVGRFLVRVFTSRHLHYAVTNQRIVITSGSAGQRITSAYLSSLPHPFFTEAPDGSGSITFGPPPPAFIPGGRGISLGSFASETSAMPVLWYVADVRRVVDLIVQAQHPQPSPFYNPPAAYPSHPGSGRRRTATMGRRSRFLLILLGGLILFATVNSVWGSWRNRPLEIGPPTPKPAASFVPVRPVGDVPMPLRATSADGSAFTSSVIVTSAGHPSGVAYMAGWQKGASLRIASLDLASGKPLFPVVDLGAWTRVYQLAARPEGILVAGLQPTSRPHPEFLSAIDQLDVHFVALDPSTGRVRWEDRARSGRQLSARLYPYGVLAANEIDVPTLLDWTTGAPRWTLSTSDQRFVDNALPAVTWVEPRLTAPLATAAELDTSTPDDPRLALRGGWVLDTRTGDWTEVTPGVGSPGPIFSATPVLVIGESVYLSASYGKSGDVLYRFPANPPQPVEHGDSLWSDHGFLLATAPCGSDRLCLTEGPTSSHTGQRMVLVDTGSRRSRALPDSVPTGGYAIGDRYVDPAGRVYDLTGALLGDSSPLASASWLTPGSLIGIDRGDPARTVGAAPRATIVAVSTVDGRRTVLGQLPSMPSQVTTANGYLVCADDDGFHALQYGQP